jgi:hypothetical protein
MTEPLNRHMRTSAPARTVRPAEDVYTADALPYSNAADDIGTEPDRDSPPSTPRWVKAFGIGAVVLVLLFAGLHLSGNMPTHGSPSGGTEHGMQAP